MKSLGSYIRECRKLRGLSQEEFGQLCGYKPGMAYKTVQTWENDRQYIPTKRLRLAAKILGVPIEHLVP